MKYSVFSACMPEYGIFETVGLLKKLGYDAVEWRVFQPAPQEKPEGYTYEKRYWTYNLSTLDIGRIEEQALEAGKACRDAGIEICSLSTYLTPGEADKVERVLQAAEAAGCPNIRVNAPKYDGSENYNALFDRTVSEGKALERLAAKHGVRILYEIHMGNIIPSASAAYRFISHFSRENAGIIYDPGNFVFEGYENYRMGIELLGGYLAHVHIKNGSWKLKGIDGQGVAQWEPDWAPLKKGYMNVKKLLGELKDKGYRGYLSVEDFSNEQETEVKLKENLEFLKSLSA